MELAESLAEFDKKVQKIVDDYHQKMHTAEDYGNACGTPREGYCLLHEIMTGANACDEKNCAHQAFCATIRSLEQRVARMEEHTRECKR